MKYFKNINTLEELRKQYKELLKKYHPDNGGDVEAMKSINVEYDSLFKTLKDKHNGNDADKNSYDNMKFDFEEDEKLRDVLQHVIILENINIEIVGCWIWIDGNTYACKEILKGLGFKWAKEKKKWYFHTEKFRKKSHKKLSMNDIRNYYGSTEVQTKESLKIAAI